MSNMLGTQIKINEISYLQFIRYNDPEKEDRMKRIFNNGKIFTIEEVAKILKTIYQNEALTFVMHYSSTNVFIISYKNNSFSYTHKIKINKNEKTEISYDENGLNFSCSNNLDQKEESITKLINEEIKRIHYLKNIKPNFLKDLQEKESILWKSYKEFYGQNPDFSKKEVCRKAQEMASILESCNLLSPTTVFEREKEFEHLAPLGEIKEKSNLEDPRKKKLRILGNIKKNVEEYLQSEQSPDTEKESSKNMILIKSIKPV